MAALDLASFAPYGGHHGLFGPGLRRPAFLIGGEAQVAIGDENHSFRHGNILPPAVRGRLFATGPQNQRGGGTVEDGGGWPSTVTGSISSVRVPSGSKRLSWRHRLIPAP